MPANRVANTRLTTWKEVAAFFGKTERTVMRWEAERGLPVRRLPGEARSSIYADVAELEAWLRGPGAAAPDFGIAAAPDLGTAAAPEFGTAAAPEFGIAAAPDPDNTAAAMVELKPVTPVPRSGMPRAWWRTGAVAAICAAVGILVAQALPQTAAPPPQAAQALYMKGLQDWAQRTPAALNAAVDEFTAAIRLDDRYAEAYVGLANCYNLLREFTAMPSAKAYALAKQAAQRAIALQPKLAGGHAAYAFALFFGDWNFAAAQAEYETALRLEPGNPGIQHWYATTLLALGDERNALLHIDRALELDPASRAVRADRALILFASGRADEARAVLLDLVASTPDFLSPHIYLAHIYLLAGDGAGFVREAAICARLQHDGSAAAVASAAAQGLATGGQAGMLAALLAAQKAAVANGAGVASDVAVTYALLGDKGAAVAWLQRAVDRHDDRAVALANAGFFRAAVGEKALNAVQLQLRLARE